jgi:hypothetical protein
VGDLICRLRTLACALAALSVSGCDPFFGLRREIHSATFNASCRIQAFDLIEGEKSTGVVRAMPQDVDRRYEERWIQRPGSYAVYMLLDNEQPSVVRLSTSGIGSPRSPDAIRATALLQDLQSALFSSCGLTEENATVSEHCEGLSCGATQNR